MKKLKILIVDDEPYARETIRTLVEAKCPEYEVAGDCFSALNALEYIKHGDINIVITDIKMPRVSGIELMRETAVYSPGTKFIVLSAYNDFELVRESLRMGAVDYIIKTEISPDKLRASLELARKSIFPGMDDDHTTMVKEGLLRQLLLIGSPQAKLLERLGKYGFNLDIKSFKIICVRIKALESYLKEEFKSDEVLIIYGIKNIINEIFENTSFDKEIFHKDNKEFIIMCEYRGNSGESERLSEIEYIYKNLALAVESYTNRKISMGISGYVTKGKRISDIYIEASNACDMAFFSENDEPVFFKNTFTCVHDALNADMYKENLSEILKGFSVGNFSVPLMQVPLTIKNADIIMISAVKNLFEHHFYIISEFLKKEGAEEFVTKETNYYVSYLKKDGSLKELNAWLKDIVKKISDLKHSHSGLYQTMKRYIIQNYASPISLNELGKFLGMNGNYVGRIFKKEFGIGFSEYLSKVRIEKSIELMKENKYNISQIATMVGYNNIEHFSRTFKKATNKSPKAYYSEL